MSELFTRWVRGTTVLAVCGCAVALGQSVPLRAPQASSAGFELPRASGTLTYALGLSESIPLQTSGGDTIGTSTNVSGHVGFLSSSERQPFSLVYSGAYLGATSGQPSSFAHNLGLSQVLQFHRYSFVLSDTISYLPDSPVSGLSGLAGLGDQGLPPLQTGQDNGAQLLSQYSPRITNTAAGSVSYAFTGVTSASGSATHSILRTMGAGIENNTEAGGAGVTHRLNALTSVSANYFFSRFTYLAYPLVYDSHTGTIEYTRQWTRNLRTDLSVGPQYSLTSGEAATLNYSLNGSASYALDRGSVGVSVVRSTNSGSGVTLASRSTSVSASGTRRLGNFTSSSVNVGYSNNVSLPSLLFLPFTTSSLTAAVQASHSISRALSAFGSYTLQHQLTGQTGLTVNALNGTTQTLSFGVTYAPRPHILGK